ncbi:MAG: inositol monophosphatase [Bacteroidota bacterium]
MSHVTTHRAARLAFVRSLAVEVGALTLEGWGRTNGTAKTADRFDVATEYDRRAEALVRERLAEAYPGEPILGEEGGLEGDAGLARERLWIVDPIDGTLNYQRGLPMYAVSIAFCEDLVPTVGVTHCPATQQTFAAATGLGATMQIADRDPVPMQANAHVSPDDALFDVTGPGTYALVAAADRLDVPRQTWRYLRSACMSFAYVAAGLLDATLHSGLSLWDCAAGEVLLQEASGDDQPGIVDFDGRPLFPDRLAAWLAATEDAKDRAAFPATAAASGALLGAHALRIIAEARQHEGGLPTGQPGR